MNDIALQNALARLTNARERVQTIEREMESLRAALQRSMVEIDGLESFIRTWHDLTGLPYEFAVETRPQVTELGGSRRPKNPDRDFVVEMCLALIRDAGKPLSRRELFEALAARGITISGKDPEMVLSTMLWRSQGKIVRLQGFGYWPREKDFPDGAYFPGVGGDIFGLAAKEPEGGVEADDAD
jgi:hypothetical protein